jgi:hypothetical protein
LTVLSTIAAGAQLAGGVVDRKHRVLSVLRQDCCQGAQPGGARDEAGGVVEGDALVVLEDEEDGALDADLLGVRSGEAVEGVLGVGTERAEPSGQVRLSVLQASQICGELGEVPAGCPVVALGLGLQWSGFAFGQPCPRTSMAGSGSVMMCSSQSCRRHMSPGWSARAGTAACLNAMGAFAQSPPAPT